LLNRRYYRLALLTALIAGMLYPVSGSAQIGDAEQAFEQARQMASASDIKAARELAVQILHSNPDYHEVRIFVARTYAWEGKYSQARSELNRVLSSDGENAEAYFALGSVEYWSGNLQLAIRHLTQSLNLNPDYSDVYIQRARVYAALNQGRRARSDLKKAAEIEPGHADIETVERSLQQQSLLNQIVAANRYEHFREGLPDRNQFYFEYHRYTGMGPLIARLNYADRSSQKGAQFELESYPVFGEKWYAYLNVGYSSSFLFPEFRSGAELYRVMPNAFELSAGFRYLSFQDNEVLIYTASVSKYWRDWFFSMRPYLNFQDGDIHTSFNLTARRYFSHQHNYLSLLAGYGFATDDSRLAEGGGSARLLESRNAGIQANRRLGNHMQVFGEVKVTEQEFPFTSDFITILTANAGLRIGF
jgi:YaiO family outer membrane protein